MANEQKEVAMERMLQWLADPHELGRTPAKIEHAGEFDYREMHYYIFKFKKSLLSKWRVAVCGGFEEDKPEPCGHIYSEMEAYHAETAEAACIKMVDRIVEFWKKQAEQYQ